MIDTGRRFGGFVLNRTQARLLGGRGGKEVDTKSVRATVDPFTDIWVTIVDFPPSKGRFYDRRLMCSQ